MNYVPGPHVFIVPQGTKLKKTKVSPNNRKELSMVHELMRNWDMNHALHFELPFDKGANDSENDI